MRGMRRYVELVKLNGKGERIAGCLNEIGMFLRNERKVTPEKIEEMRKLFAAGLNAKDVADTMHLSVSTVRRYLPKESHEATRDELDRLEKGNVK